MQGPRKNLDSCNDSDADYGQRLSPNDVDANPSASWSNTRNLSSSFSRPGRISGVEAGRGGRMFRGQGSGEACSSWNSQNVVSENRVKNEQGWSSWDAPGSSSRLEDAEYERSSMGSPSHSTAGNNLYSGSSRRTVTPHSRSTSVSQRGYQHSGRNENNEKHWQALRENALSNLMEDYREMQSDPISPTPHGHTGASFGGSSSYSLEEMDGSCSSFGNWGQSSKRKIREGASSVPQPSISSGCSAHNQNNAYGAEPSRINAFGTLNLPRPPWRRTDGSAGLLNQGSNLVGSDTHMPLHASQNAENSRRNLGTTNVGPRRDFLSSSSNENSRPSELYMAESSSRPPFGLESEAVVTSSSRSPQMDYEDMFISSDDMHTLTQIGCSVSRSNNSPNSSSLASRSPGFHDEQSLRNLPRTSAEHNTFRLAIASRYVGQDPTNWSLATEPVASSSTSRSRTASGSRPLSPPPPWIRHQNPTSNNHPRFSGFAPWTLFPSYDSETRNRNQSSRSPPLPSLSSGSTPEVMASARTSSQTERQARRRSAFVPEREDDVVHPIRDVAGEMEERRMLISEIRQVLGGARRGENSRIEDYTLFDPFIYHGLAEMHDIHRDMRLDVDNMSYEELLALEEHIGDVNTGLSEEAIWKSMKQHKCVSIAMATSVDVEPCCVCQEEFDAGEDIGKLDCGHDFHADCIKQWLMLKNLCPICKTTGLQSIR